MQKVKHNMNKSDLLRTIATVGKGTAGLMITGMLIGGMPAALMVDAFGVWLAIVVTVGAGIPAAMLVADRSGVSHIFEFGADLFKVYTDCGRRIYARIHHPHHGRGA